MVPDPSKQIQPLFLRASERRWVFEIAVSLLPVPEEDRAGLASVVINRDDEVELNSAKLIDVL